MKTILLIGGIYNIIIAIFHFGFWKLFNWRDDLKKLRFANRGILQILNIQLSFYFIFTAFLCFLYPDELLTSALGKAFLLGTAFFWVLRTMLQFIFFKVNHYLIHLLTITFLIGALLFLIPAFS